MDASECPAASFSSRDPERNLTQLESSNVVKKKNGKKNERLKPGKTIHLGVSENRGTPKWMV